MSEATVPKIMIVDDDRATSTLLRTLFQIEGYEGLICPRPEEVLQTIAQAQPDLVLMDVHLADVDSINILAAIRVDHVIGRVPVIMTSGMDVEEKCLAAGASAFMLKPFKPSELINLIRRQLAATA
jgi:DNA-binding response OmpR family regulator